MSSPLKIGAASIGWILLLIGLIFAVGFAGEANGGSPAFVAIFVALAAYYFGKRNARMEFTPAPANP